MVSSVQFGNNRSVFFKGGEDLISSPGKFSVQEETAAAQAPAADTVELSSAAEEPAKKKGGVGKAILGTIGGVVILATALWGIFKGKGEKWLNKEAETTGQKFKNAMAKPGEWIDENIVKKVSAKINQWRGKTAAEGERTFVEIVEESAEATTKNITEAAEEIAEKA